MRLDVKPSLRELVGGAARRSGRSTSPANIESGRAQERARKEAVGDFESILYYISEVAT